MKRLSALIGLTYLSALTAVFYLGEVFAKWFLCALLALLAVLFLIKRVRAEKTLIVAVFVCILACLSNIICTSVFVKPITEKYDGKSVSVEAILTEPAYESYQRFNYVLKAKSADGNKESFKFTLQTNDMLNVEVFDVIKCTVTMEKNDSGYSMSKGIFLKADAGYGDFDYKTQSPVDKPPMYYIYSIKDSLETSMEKAIDDKDAANLCNAMVWGDKYCLDASVRENFKRTGLAHVLVVSGMHLSYILIAFNFVFRKLFKNRYVHILVSLLFVLFYSAVAGFSSSIVRAGIMTAVVLCGNLFYRKSDGINSLGIAAIALTAGNPFAVGDIGLLLSFTSTFGIVMWADKITNFILQKYAPNRFLRAYKGAVSFVAVWLAASLFTAPVLIVYFKSFPIISLVSSVLVIFFADALIIIALLTCIVNLCPFVGGYVAYPFAFIARFIAKYMLFITQKLSDIPFSSVFTNKSYIYLWIAFTFILICMKLLFSEKYKHTALTALLSAIILLTGVISDSVLTYNKVNLNIYSTGNAVFLTLDHAGDCAVLSAGSDYGNMKDALVKYEQKSLKTQLMVYNYKQESQSNLCKAMLSEFDVDTVLLYNYKNTGNIKQNDNIKTLVEPQKDYFVNLWDKVSVQIINDSENKTWQYITVKNKTILLVPNGGDCEKIEQKYRSASAVVLSGFPKNYDKLKCDMLISCTDEWTSKLVYENVSAVSNRFMTTNDGDISFSYNL